MLDASACVERDRRGGPKWERHRHGHGVIVWCAGGTSGGWADDSWCEFSIVYCCSGGPFKNCLFCLLANVVWVDLQRDGGDISQDDICGWGSDDDICVGNGDGGEESGEAAEQTESDVRSAGRGEREVES